MTSSMIERRWKMKRVGKYGGMLRLGSSDALPELPKDAVVSITHGVGLNLFQALLNSIVTQWFVLPPLARNPNLLYAELHGDLSSSVTITVWRGKGMVAFRDRGAHGWAMRWLTPVLFSGKVTLWFLTYALRDGRIPTASEAQRLAEAYGKMMERGRVTRRSSRPMLTPQG